MNIRTQAFGQSAIAIDLPFPRLTPRKFLEAVQSLDTTEFSDFLRVYVEEGVPVAYHSRPMLWEAIRSWSGARLRVPPRSIGLTGSARTGFSCNPTQFGEPFTLNSDLDLTVVDESLFETAARDVRAFCAQVESGRLVSPHEREQAVWVENAKVLTRTLKLSFFDANKVPAIHTLFPSTAKMVNEASILVDRLGATPGASIKYASFRVFKTWHALSERVSTNLRALGKSVGKK